MEIEPHTKTIARYGKEIPISKAFGEAKGIEYIQAKDSVVLYKFLNDYAINHLGDYAEMVYQNIIDQKKPPKEQS